MPQFELDTLDGAGSTSKIRALNEEDAIRRAGLCGDSENIVIGDSENIAGWRTVLIGGEIRAHIRPFQRMQFRRD